MRRGGSLGVRIVRLPHRPLHVRLTRADPHVADQHVGDGDDVGAADRHLGGCAWGQRLQPHFPAAKGIGHRLRGLAAKGHAHRFARFGLAEDARRHVTLDQHVIADDARQLDLGERRAADDREDQEQRRQEACQHGAHLMRGSLSRDSACWRLTPRAPCRDTAP